MPQFEEKEFEILEEGNAIVAALCQKYPRILRTVNPEQVVVLGITNKERPSTMRKLAVIRKVTPAYRTIIRAFGKKDIQYLIELYISDWKIWGAVRQQWVVFHEILHIPSATERGLLQHDLQEFCLIVDFLGIDTYSSDSLPDMLADNPLPLREDLAIRLHEQNDKSEDGADSD